MICSLLVISWLSCLLHCVVWWIFIAEWLYSPLWELTFQIERCRYHLSCVVRFIDYRLMWRSSTQSTPASMFMVWCLSAFVFWSYKMWAYLMAPLYKSFCLSMFVEMEGWWGCYRRRQPMHQDGCDRSVWLVMVDTFWDGDASWWIDAHIWCIVGFLFEYRRA